MSSHFKFHYDYCSRLIIISVYENVRIFNNTGKIIRPTRGGGGVKNYVKQIILKIITLHIILHRGMREKLIFTWSLSVVNSDRISASLPFLLTCGNSRLYQRLRTLCSDCDTQKNTSESAFKMICGPRRLLYFVTLCEDAVPVPQIQSCSHRKKNSEDRAVNHCFGIKCKKNWLFIWEN
jgi:hypothetical protein